VDAGPGTELAEIYRARVFQTEDELKEAMKRPDAHVGRVFHFVLGGIFYRTAWDEGICAFSWTSSS
jgi:hypothetical protein